MSRQPLRGIVEFACMLHIFVWIDSGHGIQLDQAPELWLMQNWMGTSVGGTKAVASDLLVAYQVSLPP